MLSLLAVTFAVATNALLRIFTAGYLMGGFALFFLSRSFLRQSYPKSSAVGISVVVSLCGIVSFGFLTLLIRMGMVS
jgi:hypothetical protein